MALLAMAMAAGIWNSPAESCTDACPCNCAKLTQQQLAQQPSVSEICFTSLSCHAQEGKCNQNKSQHACPQPLAALSEFHWASRNLLSTPVT